MRQLMPAIGVLLAASIGCTSVPARPPVATGPGARVPAEPTTRIDPRVADTKAPRPAKAIATAALGKQVDSIIKTVNGAEVAVYFKDLDTQAELNVNADLAFHAASTMKLPVMIELYRRADRGELSLDETINLENKFPSIVDGSPFSLTREDDSDVSLYDRVGRPVSYRELNDRMITRSSNLATNALIAKLDAKTANKTAHDLGAKGMTVLRGVEDGKAFAKGLNNTTTARALGVLLEAIQVGKAASMASCAAMRDVLLQQEERGEIPAGLPAGTLVAHKTGWITATRHDAAIVYTPRRSAFILVVLTRNIREPAVAQHLIADIAGATWNWDVPPRR